MLKIDAKTYVQPYTSLNFKTLIAYILAGLEIGVLTIFIGWMLIAIVGKCLGGNVQVNDVIQMSLFTLVIPVLQMAHAIVLIIEAGNNSSSYHFGIIFFIIAFYFQVLGFFLISFDLIFTLTLYPLFFWIIVGYFTLYFTMGGYSIYMKMPLTSKKMLEVFCVIGTVLQMICQATVIALEIFSWIHHPSQSTITKVLFISGMVFALWQIADMVIIDVMIGKNAYYPKKITHYLLISMATHIVHHIAHTVILGIQNSAGMHYYILSLLSKSLFYVFLILLFIYISHRSIRLSKLPNANDPKVIPFYKYIPLKKNK